MPDLTTVISDPPIDPTPYEVDLIERVRTHGWQTTSVGADDNGDPSFSYTTGFWLTLEQPEVIVFDFPPQLSHDVFGQMARRARAGDRFSVGEPVEGILASEVIYFLPVTRQTAIQYLRSSNWFYKSAEFPVLQLVWADRSGRFPWNSDCETSLMRLQPNLWEDSWTERLKGRLKGS